MGAQAGYIFDTEMLRPAAFWTCGFLSLNGVIFDGVHWSNPSPALIPFVSTKPTPGWASVDNWKDPREIPYGPLPRDWGRFKGDKDAQSVLANTVRLATVDAKDFDTIFYSGGHGPMWDLVEDRKSISLIEEFYGSGKPVAAVCHAPAVFHHVTFQGNPLVKGKRVTGFTNSEEEAVQLTKVVPFLVEDDLKSLGAHYEKAGDWEIGRAHV